MIPNHNKDSILFCIVEIHRDARGRILLGTETDWGSKDSFNLLLCLPVFLGSLGSVCLSTTPQHKLEKSEGG